MLIIMIVYAKQALIFICIPYLHTNTSVVWRLMMKILNRKRVIVDKWKLFRSFSHKCYRKLIPRLKNASNTKKISQENWKIAKQKTKFIIDNMNYVYKCDGNMMKIRGKIGSRQNENACNIKMFELSWYFVDCYYDFEFWIFIRKMFVFFFGVWFVFFLPSFGSPLSIVIWTWHWPELFELSFPWNGMVWTKIHGKKIK